MGRLTRIQDIINDTISHYSHVKLMPRGLPIYLDQLLRGSIRFGKRLGNNVSMINPDNTMKLAEDITAGAIVINVESVISWLEPDTVITIGPQKELVEVDDIEGNQILLKTRTLQGYSAASELVALFGVPCYCMVSASRSDTELVIKSKYQMANGDVLSYLVAEDLLLSLSDVEVTQVTYLGTTTDPVYNYLYKCELDDPLSVDIDAFDKLYLRAYPAYFSNSIGIPNQVFSVKPVGPFLTDITSGNLLEGSTFKEIISIRTSSAAGDYVSGNLYSMETINKNHFVLDRPWGAHYVMFWDLAEGSMQLTPSQVVMNVNEKNHFCAGYKCVPHIYTPEDRVYRVGLTSTETCTIRFYFHPAPMQEFSLVSGATQNVDVVVPSGVDIDRLEINILGESSACSVRMTDWTPIFPTVSNIEYNLVVHVVGEALYQSSCMLIKPYFVDSELLGTRYDIGASYDTGNIYM